MTYLGDTNVSNSAIRIPHGFSPLKVFLRERYLDRYLLTSSSAIFFYFIKQVSVNSYADDVQLYDSAEDPVILESRLQDDLWLRVNISISFECFQHNH